MPLAGEAGGQVARRRQQGWWPLTQELRVWWGQMSHRPPSWVIRAQAIRTGDGMAPGLLPNEPGQVARAGEGGGDEEAGRSERREDTGGIKAGNALGPARREPQTCGSAPLPPSAPWGLQPTTAPCVPGLVSLSGTQTARRLAPAFLSRLR